MPKLPRGIGKKEPAYLGIDPSGLDSSSSGGAIALKHSSGVEAISVKKLTPQDLDLWIKEKAAIYDLQACIEKVSSMPGQGVSSTFKFGFGTGFLTGLLVANKIPYVEVTPRTWQKALSIKTKGKEESKNQFKNKLKSKAQSLYPSDSITLANCDAILIAHYYNQWNEKGR